MAFLASVLVLEVLLRSPKAPPKNKSLAMKPLSIAAGVSALACWLFIPPGSLAAPCATPWGAMAWLSLFATSVFCSAPPKAGCADGRSGYKKEFVSVALAGAAIAVLAWIAWRRGLPGSPLNFATYAAMPFWRILDPYGNVGFLLLFAGLVLARPGSPVLSPGATAQTFDVRMRRLAWCAFLAVVFVPNPMADASFSAAATFVLDYLFFGTATIFFFCLPLPERWNRTAAPGAVLCLAGTFLLLFSLHWSLYQSSYEML